MISTAYPLPFTFDVAVDNPWDGRHSVDLLVRCVSPVDASRATALAAFLQPFWLLASAGGLAGIAVEPWVSQPVKPATAVMPDAVRFSFAPVLFDERATSCVLALLLAAHDEIALRAVRLAPAGTRVRSIAFDPKLENPYPGIWPKLPFPYEIEDSESETRVLRVQFASTLDSARASTAEGLLRAWGHAAEWGAFGLAPVPPRSSACLSSEPIEHYEAELTWAIEKCRFHSAALDSLVSVCATVHESVARIAELTVE